jgi:hypothetical protein
VGKVKRVSPMIEFLFCPQHGLLGALVAMYTGADSNILILTGQLYYLGVREWLRKRDNI